MTWWLEGVPVVDPGLRPFVEVKMPEPVVAGARMVGWKSPAPPVEPEPVTVTVGLLKPSRPFTPHHPACPCASCRHPVESRLAQCECGWTGWNGERSAPEHLERAHGGHGEVVEAERPKPKRHAKAS